MFKRNHFTGDFIFGQSQHIIFDKMCHVVQVSTAHIDIHGGKCSSTSDRSLFTLDSNGAFVDMFITRLKL